MGIRCKTALGVVNNMRFKNGQDLADLSGDSGEKSAELSPGGNPGIITC